MATAKAVDAPQAGRWEFLSIAALLTFTAVCYLDGLTAPFVFDDFQGILWRQSLQSLDLADIWRDLPNRTIPLLIYGLILRTFGPTPVPFHALSLCLHLAAVLLVYTIIKTAAQSHKEKMSWPALAGAALFALHPLQTQAVVYAWQGLTIMAAALMFFSIWQFLKIDSRIPWSLQKSTYLSLGAMLLGGYCKPIAVTVLPILLICATSLRGENILQAMKKLWPWAVIAGVIALPAIFLESQEVRDIQAAKIRGTLLDPFHYFMTQQFVLVNYLQLTVWPKGLNIDHHILPVLTASDWRFLLSAGVNLSLIAAALLMQRRLPTATAGILIFYAGHLVESTILPLEDLMFEHRMYAPMLGIVMVSATFIEAAAIHVRTRTRFGTAFTAGATAIILATLAATTTNRIAIWQSRVSIWADAASKSPGKRRALVNYGLALVIEKKFAQALDVLQQAKDIDGPQNARLYDALGNAYEGLGDKENAEKSLRTALEINPADAFAWKSYGAFLGRSGRFGEAVEAFENAKTLHKNDPVIDDLLSQARANAEGAPPDPPQASGGNL